MVMTQRVIVDNGVTIEYSGPESVVERLNTSRPIETDLILEVSVCVIQHFQNNYIITHYDTEVINHRIFIEYNNRISWNKINYILTYM